MAVTRLHNERLLGPEDVEPSRDDLEVVGVFNPGAIEVEGEVVLMVRIAERPRERREGETALPRWDRDGNIATDWMPDSALEFLDPRVVRLRAQRTIRLTQTSHIRVFRSPDGLKLQETSWRLEPRGQYETFGVEDPRIVRLGDRFYVTYVAVSAHGAATALASTKDFRYFERHGIIFWPENKDVILFPEQIGGNYVALHRPNPKMEFSPPGIWLARSPDLIHWGAHRALHAGESAWEGGKIGGGTPPVRSDQGWLEIYHGKTVSAAEGEVGTYSAGVLLLDAEEPHKVLGRSPNPIMTPQTDFEQSGFVPNVVFPTGIVPRAGRVLVYYGAADTCTGVVELSIDDIVSAAT